MSKKLVIRINNLQDNENDDTYEVSEETIIRWDRVIAVSALALILLVVVIWGGWQLFSKASPAKVDEGSVTHSGSIIESDVDSQAPALGIPSEHVESTAQTPVSHKELIAIVATEKQQEPTDVGGKTIEGNVVAESVESESSAKSDATLPDHDIAVEDISEVSISSPDPVIIESTQIVKAQLTHRVKNSEPVDKLGSVIPMNEDKLIRVYLFTGMEGLKGETLYHDWYLSGKKMARVKIEVKNDKTSASSSKFIDRHMTGDWRVKVTTSRGKELVSARFNVVN